MQTPSPLRPFAAELRQLVMEHILTIVDTARQFTLVCGLRNELYWRGKQYLTFRPIEGGVGVTPISYPVPSPADEDTRDPSREIAYTFNITRGDGQKFIAVVGQRAPFVNCVPRNPRDPVSISAAEDGDALLKYLEELWDTRSLQKDVARTLWRTGPQFARMVWRQDPKYGYVTVTESRTVLRTDPPAIACPDCGAVTPTSGSGQEPKFAPPCPVCGSAATLLEPGSSYEAIETSSREEPRGVPEIELSTIFETTIPQQAKTLEECGWLVNEKLVPSGLVREQLGDLVSHIQDESRSSTFTQSQEITEDHFDLIASGDFEKNSRNDLWWVTTVWLRPEMYHYAASPELKSALRQFPSGVRLTFVNLHFVEAVEENISDVWSVCKPGTDERIVSDPLCNDLIPVQQIINDFFNLAIQIVLSNVPKTILHPELIDRESLKNNTPIPNEYFFAKPGLGSSLGDMIAKLPQGSLPPEMLGLAGALREISRELDGMLEPIFGGGAPAPTWRQDHERRNAALKQLYTAYDEMRLFWTKTHANAVKMLAKYGIGQIEVDSTNPFRFDSHIIDPASLDLRLFRIEADEKMPMTRAEEADELTNQFALPPQLQDANGIWHPLNVPRLVQLTQVPGMHSPMADLTNKTLGLIRRLLEEIPVPVSDESGMPMPGPDGAPVEDPSIKPDPFEFSNASFSAEIVRAFINSPEGERQASKNPEGFRNVRLFGNALDSMAVAQLAAQNAPPPTPDQGPPAAGGDAAMGPGPGPGPGPLPSPAPSPAPVPA